MARYLKSYHDHHGMIVIEARLPEADGLLIDENTNCIGWRGERLDLDFAVCELLYHEG